MRDFDPWPHGLPGIVIYGLSSPLQLFWYNQSNFGARHHAVSPACPLATSRGCFLWLGLVDVLGGGVTDVHKLVDCLRDSQAKLMNKHVYTVRVSHVREVLLVLP